MIKMDISSAVLNKKIKPKLTGRPSVLHFMKIAGRMSLQLLRPLPADLKEEENI